MKKTSKSAKIKKAETIIRKLVDLRCANNGWCPYLQDAQLAVRKYIENIENSK
jgi:hypothetical protein